VRRSRFEARANFSKRLKKQHIELAVSRDATAFGGVRAFNRVQVPTQV